MFELSGSNAADVMIVDHTATSYLCLHAATLFKNREKHKLQGATIVPLRITAFGKLGPAAEEN
jgi:hypothetical protein